MNLGLEKERGSQILHVESAEFEKEKDLKYKKEK